MCKHLFSSCPLVCIMLSHSQLFVTPWTVACRRLCPWDFPGKNTGVGCHFLLQNSKLTSINKLVCISKILEVLKNDSMLRRECHDWLPWCPKGSYIFSGACHKHETCRYKRASYKLEDKKEIPAPLVESKLFLAN